MMISVVNFELDDKNSWTYKSATQEQLNSSNSDWLMNLHKFLNDHQNDFVLNCGFDSPLWKKQQLHSLAFLFF